MANVHYKYAYYDETGKRRVKTFTSETMTKAKKKAKAWERERGFGDDLPRNTVDFAMSEYIEAKSAVLSPSTIRYYRSIRKTHFDDIKDIPLYELRQADIQRSISKLAASNVSAKTVRNCHGFLMAALAMQDKRLKFDIQLPQRKRYEPYCPSDSDIKVLLSAIQNDGDEELLRGVLLAAFGPMRRSELCGLRDDDIKGNVVYVRRAIVKDTDGNWVEKLPKTSHSQRKIVFPDFVIERLKGINGKIINCTPDSLGDKFRATVKKAGLPHFRFHDLRHYGASIMMYMGISMKTVEARGGWSPNSPVLRQMYLNTIEDEMTREVAKVNERFSEVFRNEIL